MSADNIMKIHALTGVLNSYTDRLNQVQTKCVECDTMIVALDAIIVETMIEPDSSEKLEKIDKLNVDKNKHCLRKNKFDCKIVRLNSIINTINSNITALSP